MQVCRCRRFRDQGAAVAIGCGDEACGDVVAQERNGGGVGAIGDGKRATGVVAVFRVGQSCGRAKGTVRSMPLRGNASGAPLLVTLPPLTTPGSVISMVPLSVWLVKFADVYVPTKMTDAETPPLDTVSVPLVLEVLRGV